MSTPSLGYEDNVEIAKSTIAQIQLVESISFFLQGNYVCSITLAGAAEAIFAGILEAEGITSVVEDSVAAIQAIRDKTLFSPMDGKPNKEIFNAWNTARNEMKHHGKVKPTTITLNLFDEAYWMIRRALVNADKAGTAIANAQNFERWIIKGASINSVNFPLPSSSFIF